MMASKLAYENAAFIENVVTNYWKMHFVGFYSCWHKYLEDFTTQAFICCNKETDPDIILLAFRGTEPFNTRDWCTDVNLSRIPTGENTGSIHLGFLEALGLQDEKDFGLGFPKDFQNPDKENPLAYYVLRDTLKTLLLTHKNAKIVITGHSLGAALSVVFPVLLSIHGEDEILDAIGLVMNYGQPRVGDAAFARYMVTFLKGRYFRMVYRYDIVARIPFDKPPIASFKHCGTCVYFDGWYKGQEMDDDSPNPNYFMDLLYYTPRMHLGALGDFFKALFIRWTQGKEYKECKLSIFLRLFGIMFPGIAMHSPRDYLNAARLTNVAEKIAAQHVDG